MGGSRARFPKTRGLVMDLRIAVEAACILEATARKPGNVHPGRSFGDLAYGDLLAAALAIGPPIAASGQTGIGQAILSAVRATRGAARGNPNLGIILLLAPLAAAPRPDPNDVGEVLEQLTVEDARKAYAAIREAAPGGLGRAQDQDVADEPTVTLREAMRLAAGRDAVARQYATGYADVFGLGLEALLAGLERTGVLEDAILWCQLSLLAALGDTLIARKLGSTASDDVRARAAGVLEQLGGVPRPGLVARAPVRALDRWLRESDNARNPGATADLVAACLFWGLRSEKIDPRGTAFLPPAGIIENSP